MWNMIYAIIDGMNEVQKMEINGKMNCLQLED